MANAPTIYIVIDIRTVPDGDSYAAVINKTQHLTRNKAEARYHSALASAAIDDKTFAYSAVLMTNEGFVIASQCYEHDYQPQPEPEPEGEGE